MPRRPPLALLRQVGVERVEGHRVDAELREADGGCAVKVGLREDLSEKSRQVHKDGVVQWGQRCQ